MRRSQPAVPHSPTLPAPIRAANVRERLAGNRNLAVITLKIVLQAELNLPPGSGSGGQFSEIRISGVARASRWPLASERGAAGGRQEERRCIGSVEQLRSKLQKMTFREVEVLEQGSVHIPRPRPARVPLCGGTE